MIAFHFLLVYPSAPSGGEGPGVRSKLISFLLLISISIAATAQLKEEYINKLQLNIKPFLEEADPDFTTNTIPEKWKDQSGVILAQKTAMMFDQRTSFRLLGKSDRKVIVQEKERRKNNVAG